MAAHNSLRALSELETEVHHKPLSQVQSHRLIATEESYDAGALHPGFTLQLVVRNSAFSNRTFEEVRYRRFSLTSIHGANYHSKDRPNQ
jgi:hypothetical protein